MNIDARYSHLHWAAGQGLTQTVLNMIQCGDDKAKVAGILGTPLHQAAGCGHLSTVKAMIKAGCPVDVVASNGESVLHHAALGGNVKVIRELLRIGCNINVMDNEGRIPLHAAASIGNTKAALELIRLGAERAKVAGKHGTPLHQAAARGHVSTVKEMLRVGCPLDVMASNGCSILHFAAASNNVDLIRELVSKGCNINAIDHDGETPLHVAAFAGKTEAVLAMLRLGAKKCIVARERGTPLHQAAYSGHVPTVRAMLKAGCPVDIVDSNGDSVLHAAAQGGSPQVFKDLLSAGCDINARATDGETPLHLAAVQGGVEEVLELIKQGADKAIVAGVIGTPLHQAVAVGHLLTVKAMLKAGCPLDVLDSNGESVLHYAARNGDDKVLEELLDRLHDLDTTDVKGNTPLDYAARCGHEKAVLKLVRCGADKTRVVGFFGSTLLAAASGGHWSTVEVLLKEGFPEYGKTEDGKTMIHLVSMGGKIELLHLFAAKGFNISLRDDFGLTPLHYAVLYQHGKCVKALLQLGASAKASAPLLGTPLNVGRLYSTWDMVDVLSGNTLPFYVRRSDEVIIDFALCKELGIKIESPHIFSEHSNTISVFENTLFLYNMKDTNKVRVPKELRKVLSIFSRLQLVDLNKLACLAAIHGDVLVLECLSEILTLPVEPGQYYCRLKQLFPVQFKDSKGSLPQVLRPEFKLNPLQLAIIAMMCTKGKSHVCTYRSRRRYNEVINMLTSNDSYCHFLNDNLPNGLSPLDLAKQLKLDEAVTIITRAGGRHGIWADIPQEVCMQHGSDILRTMLQLMDLASSGTLGQQAVQSVLSHSQWRTTKVEQGTSTEESHLCQKKVLDQRPDLPVIVKVLLPKVEFRNWEEIGIRLDVPNSILFSLKYDQSRLRDKYRTMLSCWLEHSNTASWGMLLDVLGHYETKHTMDQLTQDILATEGSEVRSNGWMSRC